jgi:hypothetical protein
VTSYTYNRAPPPELRVAVMVVRVMMVAIGIREAASFKGSTAGRDATAAQLILQQTPPASRVDP